MSKMGQKFEDNLNSAKYDLYNVVKSILSKQDIENGRVVCRTVPSSEDIIDMAKIIVKVEEL